MPIEELLALYNCAPRPAPITSETKLGDENLEATKDTSVNEIEEDEDEDEVEEEPSQLMKLYSPVNNASALPEEDEEEDGEYSPDEDDIKKTIMVGGDYQAIIPEGLCRYDDALPYENEDKLLWNPTVLNEKEIEEYLEKVKHANQSNANGTDVYAIPLGKHLRDDEQSLLLLLQCGHNVEEALRRKRINAVQPSETMTSWSEEECRNFECGLRIYGKDFHAIQQSKVRTRSVGELVQFYYIWKKTERHDVFASKTRLEKKKYSLHPGLTDHMDRFLEEQENGNGIGGRSSPAVSILYTDNKRQRQNSTGRNRIFVIYRVNT